MAGIMVSTFQALGVFLLAFLPGAWYVWAFERQAGGWGLSLSDRLLRFIGTSAVFQALGAPITYVLYGTYVHSGRLARGAALPWGLWVLVVAYVVVPIGCGYIVGRGVLGPLVRAGGADRVDPAADEGRQLDRRRLRPVRHRRAALLRSRVPRGPGPVPDRDGGMRPGHRSVRGRRTGCAAPARDQRAGPLG